MNDTHPMTLFGYPAAVLTPTNAVVEVLLEDGKLIYVSVDLIPKYDSSHNSGLYFEIKDYNHLLTAINVANARR